eukprot:gene31392-37945_t
MAEQAQSRTIPKLKLYYFNIAGVGEIIRLACAYGNLPFEDVRLSGDQFRQMRDEGKLTFGQLPALQVDDNTFLFQSAAILRYVGKFAGLYPTNDDILAAKIDALVDQEKDMFTGVSASRYRDRFGFDMLSEETVAAIRKKLNDEILPRHLSYFEAFLSKSPSGWLMGGPEPTIADFVISIRVKWLVSGANDGITEQLLDPFPGMRRLIEQFDNMPQVLAYYQTHPNK